jgi:hypothetical protein
MAYNKYNIINNNIMILKLSFKCNENIMIKNDNKIMIIK